MSVAVRVLRDDEPVSGKKVMISFTRLDRGWLEEWTNSDGVAHFDADEGEAKIIIDGSTVETCYLSDEVTVNI